MMMEANVEAVKNGGRALPSDLQQTVVVAKYDIMKYLRSRIPWTGSSSSMSAS